MGLVIYQVGDVPVFHRLVGIDNSGVSVSTDRSWKATETELINASGAIITLDPLRPVSNTSSLSLQGNLISDTNSNAQALFNRLMSFGGFPTIPIVAFYYNEHVDLANCCGSCPQEITWLFTTGILESIDVDTGYASVADIHNFAHIPVNMSINMDYFWRIVDSLEWEYRKDRVTNPLDPKENVYESFYLPQRLDEVRDGRFFYRWLQEDDIYETSLWGTRFDGGENGGVGSDFTEFGTVEFLSDPAIWSAPPSSLYAFTELTTGTLTLKSVRPALHFMGGNVLETTATLDIDALNTGLASNNLQELQNSDIIVTGFAKPFPGFLYRLNTITGAYEKLTTLRPEWIYDGVYPGETGIGFNRITASVAGGTGRWAYLHSFGVY